MGCLYPNLARLHDGYIEREPLLRVSVADGDSEPTNDITAYHYLHRIFIAVPHNDDVVGHFSRNITNHPSLLVSNLRQHVSLAGVYECPVRDCLAGGRATSNGLLCLHVQLVLTEATYDSVKCRAGIFLTRVCAGQWKYVSEEGGSTRRSRLWAFQIDEWQWTTMASFEAEAYASPTS